MGLRDVLWLPAPLYVWLLTHCTHSLAWVAGRTCGGKERDETGLGEGFEPRWLRGLMLPQKVAHRSQAGAGPAMMSSAGR